MQKDLEEHLAAQANGVGIQATSGHGDDLE
jgi:hypothetical protein